jgi:hypothetical protein
MELVEIDVVAARVAQRFVEQAVQPGSGKPGRVGALVGRVTTLGCQDDAIADLAGPAGEPLADDRIGLAAHADIGGIDQASAQPRRRRR